MEWDGARKGQSSEDWEGGGYLGRVTGEKEWATRKGESFEDKGG